MGRSERRKACRVGDSKVTASTVRHGLHFSAYFPSGGLIAVAYVEALQAGIMIFGSVLLMGYGK
jgi:hypothetical protein